MGYINYDVAIHWDYNPPPDMAGYAKMVGVIGNVFYKDLFRKYVGTVGSIYTIGDVYAYTAQLASIFHSDLIGYHGYCATIWERYYKFIGYAGTPIYPSSKYVHQGLIFIEPEDNKKGYKGALGSDFHCLPVFIPYINYYIDDHKNIIVSIKGSTSYRNIFIKIKRKRIDSDTYEVVDIARVDKKGHFEAIDDGIYESGIYTYKFTIENNVYYYNININFDNIFLKAGTWK